MKSQIKAYVSKELKEKVQAFSQETGVSESNIISLAVTWYLAKESYN